MSDSLSQQANKQLLDQIKAEKPSQFTVGLSLRDGKLVGGATYERKWSNGWGAVAYARAWWDDLPVSVSGPTATVHKPTVEAGVEVSKRF